MSRNGIVHAVVTCAVALVLLLTMMSCARAPLHADDASMNASENYEMDMNAVEVDVGSENAMAAPTRPDFETSPPPPPPPPVAAERDGPDEFPVSASVRHTNYRATASMDTAAEGPAAEIDNRPFAGLGAFVKPKPPVWKVDAWYTLEFVVGRNEAALKDVSEDRELMPARNIQMAPTMRVTLDPHPDFDIKPQNPDQEIQELSPERTAAWFWNVKPHKAGKYTLVARVQALVRGPDGELVKGPDGKLKGRFLPPRSVEIKVQVGTKEKVGGAIDFLSWLAKALGGLFESWQKMLVTLTALITAAGGVYAAVRKLQGKPIRPRRLRRKKA